MQGDDLIWLFYALLFAVAFLYASVGHGGASGYLVLMALFGIGSATTRSSALMLNVFVSLIAFIQYYRHGYFHWKLFLPFALASVPASFIGSLLTLDEHVYRKVLGVLLLLPLLRLLGITGEGADGTRLPGWHWPLLAGALIGLVSGLTGIGGGIILSPLLLLMHWAGMKETAATSALFIFVNSLAGLGGQFYNGAEISPQVYLWTAIAVAGGAAGAHFGGTRFRARTLRTILAAALVVASAKLLFYESETAKNDSPLIAARNIE